MCGTNTLDGELIEDERITENHAIMMYEPMLSERAGYVGEQDR